MFTGIVQGVGSIVAATPSRDGVRLTISVGALDVSDVAVGDSIAVDGCCLTVVALHRDAFAFDVSAETLRCTAPFTAGRRVNLEKSLRLADRLGGHLVLGHVDGVGTVTDFRPVVDSDAAGSHHLEIEAPIGLAQFIAAKGAIAVHGISLTTNTVEGTRFAVNLIPHTLDVTTLKDLAPGAAVNLEVDIVARYVARLAAYGR